MQTWCNLQKLNITQKRKPGGNNEKRKNTPIEKKHIQAAAEAFGMTISEYVRYCTLVSPPTLNSTKTDAQKKEQS